MKPKVVSPLFPICWVPATRPGERLAWTRSATGKVPFTVERIANTPPAFNEELTV